MKNILLELGLKYPIIQGGMANIATSEFAASVCHAGGLGTIGTGGWTPDKVEAELAKMDSLVGDMPYAVNVMLMNPYAEEIIDIAINHGVKVITTGAGNPGKYVEKIKAGGALLIPVVPSVALARRMERSGVDAVIAEGTESGGHIGELTTMALVPQVVDAVNIPVIAAGGIACSRQYAASLCLGAVGVQIGTVLLATDECPIHENYKQLIVEAKDISTTVTGRSKGVPVRALKNKMTREYQKLESQAISSERLEELTLGSLSKAVYDGNVSEGSFMSGQVAGQVKEIKTVAQVLAEISQVGPVLKQIEEYHE
ncbi:nitronate monooxygenase [Mollicutes bacterium LVI A0039]|nr:nitronate monooxygenase [Mollicutes bacterium LVI A0039]